MIEVHGTRVTFIFLCIQWKTLFEQGRFYTQRLWDSNQAASGLSAVQEWVGEDQDWVEAVLIEKQQGIQDIRKEKLTAFGTTHLDKEEISDDLTVFLLLLLEFTEVGRH